MLSGEINQPETSTTPKSRGPKEVVRAWVCLIMGCILLCRDQLQQPVGAWSSCFEQSISTQYSLVERCCRYRTACRRLGASSQTDNSKMQSPDQPSTLHHDLVDRVPAKLVSPPGVSIWPAQIKVPWQCLLWVARTHAGSTHWL